MQMKVYPKGCCPLCGVKHASHRQSRNWLLRLLFPSSRLMKCSLCKTSYLTRGAPSGDAVRSTVQHCLIYCRGSRVYPKGAAVNS